MSSREQDVAEPSAEGGNYEAQAGSSTPVAPSRERQPRTEESPQPQANDPEAIDERAATTKTQPMARLQGDQQPSKHSDRSDGLIQDHRWDYFAGRWDSIQSGFVDDPRRTVEQADRLVAEVIDHLSKMFTAERAKLEAQWSRGGKADTEDLRIAMQRYRDFFRTLTGR